MAEQNDTRKEKLIFDVLKAGLMKAPFPKIPEEDWKLIERELNSQTVTALPEKSHL